MWEKLFLNILDIYHMEMLKEGCKSLCPGCSHRNLTTAASLGQKEQWLKKMLEPWKENFNPIRSLPENQRWGYRGKVCLNTSYMHGEWKFGMLKRDELIDIPDCPVHTDKIRKTIEILRKILPPADKFPMAFYYHAHAQVTLILKTKILPDVLWLNGEVCGILKDIGIEGLAIHLHPSAGRRLFDKSGWYQVYGRNFSFDNQDLIYGNTSFHQLISSLYYESLSFTEDFFQLNQKFSIADLYCGRGVSLNLWTKYKLPVIGIETGGEAVTCARINAPDTTVLQGTCERRLPQLEAWRQFQLKKDPDTLFALYTNPPRTGMEPKVNEWITQNLKPVKIAYLSCSAGTLRKDLDKITHNGYKVCSITPFDFFPQTYHVECLVLMEKIENV